MHRFQYGLLIPLLVILLLAGCSQATTQEVAEAEPTATAIISTPEPTIEPTIAPTPEPTPTEEPIPVAVEPGLVAGFSPTTGRAWTEAYHPVCVMIENSAAARPHSGLSQADVVYECTVEGAITRFMAVFSDTMPEKVGPVRSCRIYYVDLQQEWDALLVHFGGPVKGTGTVSVYEKFERDGVKQRLDGISGHASIARDSGRAAPHNAYVNLTKAQPAYNYEPEYVHAWFFDAAYPYQSAQVAEVTIPYPAAGNTVRYVWDGERSAWARFLGTKPFMDREPNEQVYVTNVVVQRANQVGMGTREGHINIELIGSGTATFYIRGMQIEGTWEKADGKSRTVFRDMTGEEIRFAPGNTWIQFVPLDMQVAAE